MERLLIINNENKKISDDVLEFLNNQYHILEVNNHRQAYGMLNDEVFDLFLLITSTIDINALDLLDVISETKGNLLPVVISLPVIDEVSEVLAFRKRVLYLTPFPLELGRLKTELANVSEILDLTSDKKITLSSRKYDKTYSAKEIIYFERNRPRYLTVYGVEASGEIFREEFFYKYAIEKFVAEYGLKRHFIQIHQSFLVNPKFIEKFNKLDLEVVLTNKETIPLGMTYYRKLKEDAAK